MTSKDFYKYKQAKEFLEQEHILDLAEHLKTPILSILNSLKEEGSNYSSFSIHKKKGGFRTIEAPSNELKKIQRQLNVQLNVVYQMIKPTCVHGFIKTVFENEKSLSIVSNAKQHVKAAFVLNLDLKDFFHSIDIWRVKEVFMCYPFYFPNNLASYLALLTTYQDRLPMGAPTSPVISNLVCFLFDRKMMRMASENNLTFTRYADDLTFSSDKAITPEIIEKIKQVIAEFSFTVNEKKTRILTKNSKQVVTGLTINEKVNVDRRYIRNIRAMLYNWESMGLTKAAAQNKSESEFLFMVKGKLDFLSMVKGKNDAVFLKLYHKFRILEARLPTDWDSNLNFF